MSMNLAVILPAAGLGRRFNAGVESSAPAPAGPPPSKIELDLCGKPVFLRAVELFLKHPGITQVILAVNPEALDAFQFRYGEKLAFLGVTVVPGGRVERWETVLKSLAAIKPGCTHVAVHDAARPLTSPALLDRVLAAAENHPAVIPGIPASATLKKIAPLAPTPAQVDPLAALLGTPPAGAQLKKVVGAVDRRDLIEVQTPQVFALELLQQAYAQIAQGKVDGAGITDDAGLVEALGQTVVVVEGESTNIKITRPEDLDLARAFITVNASRQTASLARKRLFTDEEED